MKPWHNLIELIKEQPRLIKTTTMFTFPAKICLLDFIGTGEHFITSFGLAWARKKVYLNRQNVLTRGYMPMATLDRTYRYPWVNMPLNNTNIWFPINMLLGWGYSYKPGTEFKAQHFVSSDPAGWGWPVEAYHWEDINWDILEDGPYKQFLQNIYLDD